MIGDDAAVFADQEAGAEDIDLEMRARAAGIELDHALLIDDRFAKSIDRNLNWFARRAIKKFDDDVEQTNARRICVNDGFGDFTFGLERLEPRLCLGELLLQRCGLRSITPARGGFFLDFGR